MARHSLPRAERWSKVEQTPPPGKDQKTVLVVDGDPDVLRFVSEVLVDGNYNVLTARSGSLALERSRDFKSDIHLLLSEFQMTGMNGMDLATQMSRDRPQLQVLLMSGFPDGMLVLNEGWHFLAKPFIPSQLRTLIKGLVSPEKSSKFSK
jgi:DNA-binding NtrC family response regulator